MWKSYLSTAEFNFKLLPASLGGHQRCLLSTVRSCRDQLEFWGALKAAPDGAINFTVSSLFPFFTHPASLQRGWNDKTTQHCSSMGLSWTWHLGLHKGLILHGAVDHPSLFQLSWLQREEGTFYHLLRPRISVPSSSLEVGPYLLTTFSTSRTDQWPKEQQKAILTGRNHLTAENHGSGYQQKPLPCWKACSAARFQATT